MGGWPVIVPVRASWFLSKTNCSNVAAVRKVRSIRSRVHLPHLPCLCGSSFGRPGILEFLRRVICNYRSGNHKTWLRIELQKLGPKLQESNDRYCPGISNCSWLLQWTYLSQHMASPASPWTLRSRVACCSKTTKILGIRAKHPTPFDTNLPT